MRSILFFLIFLLVHHFSGAQAGYDTAKVFFPINVISLDAQAQKELNLWVQKIGHRKILIYGYADYLGNEPANMDLAKGRAKNVQSYLIKKGINKTQILICEGIGEVKRNLPKRTEGYPEDRRVVLFIKKNSVEINNPTIAKNTASNTRKIKVNEISDDGTLIPVSTLPIKTTQKNSNTNSKPKISSTPTGIKNKTITTPVNSRFDALAVLKANEVMRIESIQFQPTRHFIMKDSEPILQELLQTLRDNPELAINIEGHVCCMQGDGDALDTDTRELKLSENRAKFIYQYLIEHGIEADRLGYIGFGKKRPLVPIEETEEDAQKNRRVEIRVVRN